MCDVVEVQQSKKGRSSVKRCKKCYEPASKPAIKPACGFKGEPSRFLSSLFPLRRNLFTLFTPRFRLMASLGWQVRSTLKTTF